MEYNHQLPPSSGKSCDKDSHIPVISVIMSNYNTELDILKESIDSILNQTFTDFEFIIVDDCSSREMQADTLIAEYNDDRIIYLKNEQNLGLAGSLNRAMSIARGKYIARMDTDDISLPDRFEKQVKYMEKHKEIVLLSTRAKIFGKRKGYLFIHCRTTNDSIKAFLLFANCFVHPTIMFRTSFLNKNNICYSPLFKRTQDYELWSKIVRCTNEDEYLAELPEFTLKYRTSDSQASSKHRNDQLQNEKKIHLEQLLFYGIAPSEKEIQIHEILAQGEPFNNISLEEVLNWANKLKEIAPKINKSALYNQIAERVIISFRNNKNNTLKDIYKIIKTFGLHTSYYFINSLRSKILLQKFKKCN